MRLIDADRLIEAITINPVECPGCPEPEWAAEMVDLIDAMPTAEPELATNLQQSCNQLATDTISRQAAIDLVRDVCDAILSQCGSHYDGEDEVYDSILEVHTILKCNKEIRIALAGMPSAEPEDTIEMQEADIDETMKRLRDARVTILPSAEPVRCKDCKHNPKDEWFGCPMSHLSEAQRPETAWCWKGERRTDAETEV